MNFGSLFAGIGGIDLGLERAGMECSWQVEIDEFCTKVLTKHWPDVPKYGDIRDVGKENLETVDLIAGGFPCQPVSISGEKKGESDERWLWDDFYRIICEIRPKWILVENVPGLLSTRNGRLFGGILRDLSTLRYDAEWQTIQAATIGAPHLRDRVFICAYPNGSIGNSEGVFYKKLDKKKSSVWEFGGMDSTRAWEKTINELCLLDDGLPSGVGELAALGNAVVPQVAEHIGRMIMEANKCSST